MKMYKITILILSSLLLTGCSYKVQKPMTLAANVWIGYSPLYYAYEKGWFRENDIKFVATISLGETLKYYKKGSFDMFAGTNYEYKKSKEIIKDLSIVKLLDISKGGDLIYSNKNINELKNARKIDVLLEIKSINYLLLDKFIKKYSLKKEQLNLINKRADITLNTKMQKNPTLIVTYKPYDENLKKENYKVVATANSLNFVIFDALFVSKKYEQNHKEKIKKVIYLFDKALSVLRKNPHDFYAVIKSDFYYKKYDQFKKDLNSIAWNIPKSLKNILNQGDIQ